MTSDTDRTELVRAIRAASERHTDAETTRRILAHVHDELDKTAASAALRDYWRRVREHLDAGGNMEDIL